MSDYGHDSDDGRAFLGLIWMIVGSAPFWLVSIGLALLVFWLIAQ